MKRPVRKAVITECPKHNTVFLGTLAVGVAAIMLIAGCQEQNLSNTKKSRLIASENIQLKKELEQHSTKIEELQALLEGCREGKKMLEEQSQEHIEGLIGIVLDSAGEENKKLLQENERLKAQIQQLETQVQQLEKSLRELKNPAVPKPL